MRVGNFSIIQTCKLRRRKKKKQNYSRERGNWSKKRWPQRVGFIYSSSTVTYMKTSVFCFLQRSNNLMNSSFSFIAKVPFSQKAYLVGWNYFKGLFAIIWLMYVFLLHISLCKSLLQNINYSHRPQKSQTNLSKLFHNHGNWVTLTYRPWCNLKLSTGL